MGLMNFLKKIFLPIKKRNLIHFYLRDKKCGEKIKLVIRKSYDVNRLYNKKNKAKYEINKVVICNECYNKIEMKVLLDKNYNIVSKEINNGEFITENEYNYESN
ncbi:MAG: hypothetical protein ACOCRK_00425 [bacterium]